MSSDNRISVSISPETKAQVIAKIRELKSLMPFLINLTLDERKDIVKLKDKSVAFDQKCASYMAARPELIPGFIDTAELTKDRALMADLADIFRELNMLNEGVEDTMSLAGSEAFMADLAFYQSVRQAAKRGVPGSDAIYYDLRLRFPGRPPNKRETPAA